MRRTDDQGINGLRQLVEILTLIQGLAGWQAKAITIKFGRRLGPLSKSAKYRQTHSKVSTASVFSSIYAIDSFDTAYS